MYVARRPGIVSEAELLLPAVDPAGRGWIAQANDRGSIRPYMGNYFAIGLVSAYRKTGNTKYLRTAQNWAGWYRDHTDSASPYYMHDFGIDGSGNLTDLGLGAADSTDAYPGLYLWLLWLIWKTTNDTAWLQTHATGINKAYQAIVSTQEPDGLTWAKPTYLMKYLEDNIEAAVGLACVHDLATAVGNNSLATNGATASAAMQRGMAYMWNAETHTWEWAIDSNGVRTRTDWADENSQRQSIWSVAFGVAPASEQAQLANNYASHLNVANGQFEIMRLWAYKRINDTTKFSAALASTNSMLTSWNRAWPWGTLVGGQYLVATCEGLPLMPNLTIPDLGGHNKAPNPTLTDGNADNLPDGWDNYGGPINSYVGGVYQMVVAAGQGNDLHASSRVSGAFANKWWTFSAYTRNVALEAGGQCVIKIEWFDNNGNLLTYGYNIYNAVETSLTRKWISMLAPAGAVQANIAIGMENGGTIRISNIQFEEAGGPTPFVTTP